jgi:phage gp36-like protein
MASWTTLDKSFLLANMLSAEVVALSALKSSAQEDPVEKAIESMCQEIYGFLANAGYAVPEYAAIPKELERAALALIRWEVLTRVPGATSLQTETRKDAATEARALLKLVAEGKFKVTPLDSDAAAEEQPNGPPKPTFTGRARRERWIS